MRWAILGLCLEFEVCRLISLGSLNPISLNEYDFPRAYFRGIRLLAFIPILSPEIYLSAIAESVFNSENEF
jgi:hypothetical protein